MSEIREYKTMEEVMKFVNSKNINEFLIQFSNTLIQAVTFKEGTSEHLKELVAKLPLEQRESKETKEMLNKVYVMCNDVTFKFEESDK